MRYNMHTQFNYAVLAFGLFLAIIMPDFRLWMIVGLLLGFSAAVVERSYAKK